MSDLKTMVKSLSDQELEKLIPTLSENEYNSLMSSLGDSKATQPIKTQQKSEIYTDPRSLVQRTIESPIVQKAIDIPSQVSYGAYETLSKLGGQKPLYDEKPKSRVGEIARFAGELSAPIPGGGATGAIIEKSLGMAAKSPIAIRAGAAASNLGSKAIGKVGDIIGKNKQDIFTYTAHLLNSVPEQYIQKALDMELKGKSILAKPFSPQEYEKIGRKAQSALRLLERTNKSERTYADLGKRIQEATNYVIKEAGKKVGAEKEAIRTAGRVIDTAPLISQLDNQLSKFVDDNVSSLTKADIKHINEIKGMLLKGTKPETIKTSFVDQFGVPVKTIVPGKQPLESRLMPIKRQIDNIVGYSKEDIRKPSALGDVILKDLRNTITGILEENNPALKKVNAKYANISGLRDQLLSELKNKNVQKTVRNMSNKDLYTQELFRKLNDAVPDNMKFMPDLQKAMSNKELAERLGVLKSHVKSLKSYPAKNFEVKDLLKELDAIAPERWKFSEELENTIVRDALNQLYPGRGGGSGGAEGAANIFRAYLATKTGGLSLPLSSPASTKKAIQAIGRSSGLQTPESIRKTSEALKKTGSVIKKPAKYISKTGVTLKALSPDATRQELEEYFNQ